MVLELVPHSGLIRGGTEVTVKGLRLVPAKRVLIGRQPCIFRSNPDGSIVLTTPPRTTGGSWDVVVTSTNGSVGVSQVKFSYVADAKDAPTTAVRNPDVEHPRPRRRNVFHRVNAVVVTAMTGNNLIVHSELVPNDKTKHTLAAIRKVFEAQKEPGRALLKSVHVDNARKLDTP